jgi:hypothetical protein
MKKSSLLVIPMLLTLASCEETTKPEKGPSAGQLEQKVSTKKEALETDKEYAARLTRVGEILVNNPVGFKHAHDLFNDALKLDPKNNKALFYSALTGIVMSYDGIGSRSKSLFEKPEDYDAYVNYLTEKIKYPEFVDFVVGKKTRSKFNNYQDIKKFFQAEVVDSFEEANKKLNKIDGDVNVILTQLKTSNTEVEYDCVDYNDNEGDAYTECQLKEEMSSMEALPAHTVTIDSNDIKILAGGLKGYSSVFKLYTAYAITGQKHITNEVKVKEMELGRELNDREMKRLLDNYPDYLTLEKDHRMNEIVTDLENIVEVGMDLETLNNMFCDNELRENNLIKTICFSETAREDMQKALDQLAGPREVLMGHDKNGAEVKILVDLPAFLRNPVADLKTLATDTYDEDGNFEMTEEPNLNGLFPNKDLLEKSKLIESEDE